MLKTEIIEELERLGIEHDPNALKPDLEALLPATDEAEELPEVEETTVEVEVAEEVEEDEEPEEEVSEVEPVNKHRYRTVSRLKHDGVVYEAGAEFYARPSVADPLIKNGTLIPN